MARTIEQEREQLAAEERKLGERRRQLAERERLELLKEVEKSGLLKGDGEQIRSILAAIKSLGVAEAVKRLAA